MRTNFLFGISSRFHELSQAYRQVAHVLLTHPPLVPQTHTPNGDCLLPALDWDVLGTPAACVLSQDQTIHTISRAVSFKRSSGEVGTTCRPTSNKSTFRLFWFSFQRAKILRSGGFRRAATCLGCNIQVAWSIH